MNKTNIAFLWALLMLPILSFSQLKSSSLEKEKQVTMVLLNNGVKMPRLGFGTLYLRDSIGINSVSKAIAHGYRLLDTAPIYGNEKEVGEGIRKSGIDRKELFITTKLWIDDMGYESTKKALELSMEKLGVDYIDLYLIHRPRKGIKESWKAMEELYEAGKIRAIGVSNFTTEQLNELLSYAKIKPAVNQVEAHVFFQQLEAQKAMQKMDIQMEAWSPLVDSRNNIFDNTVIATIGKKYNKSNAQVALRWLIQRGIVAIPRTSNENYMSENIDIFDFELDDADMKQIATLDLDITQFPEWD